MQIERVDRAPRATRKIQVYEPNLDVHTALPTKQIPELQAYIVSFSLFTSIRHGSLQWSHNKVGLQNARQLLNLQYKIKA